MPTPQPSLPGKLSYSLHLRLKGSATFFGPGVADLLWLVDETHSLHMAAQRMHMAYSKAWRIVRAAEGQLGFPLLLRQTGGSGGGGSELTGQGRAFLQKYDTFQREAYRAADKLFEEIFGGPPG